MSEQQREWPWIKFFPRDWLADVRVLSSSATGWWINFVCSARYSEDPGIMTKTLAGYAAFCADLTPETTLDILEELITTGVADVHKMTREASGLNGDATEEVFRVTCRRLVRDHQDRLDGRERMRRHRAKEREEETEPKEEVKEKAPRGLSEAERAVGEAWNAMAASVPQIPSVRSMKSKRLSALRARMKDPAWRETYQEAIETIPSSDFLCGRTRDGDWAANIDWFLRPGNVEKVIEGNYANKQQGSEQHRQDPNPYG